MTKDVFRTLYDKSLIPYGNSIKNNLGINFMPDFDILYNEYHKQKTFLRLLCNKLKYSMKKEDLLDRHKVCAALCVAIINSNFLVPKNSLGDDNLDLGKFEKYNEQLAAAVSLDFLIAFNKAESKSSNSEISVADNDNYSFPTPQDPNEEYADVITRTLYFAHTVGQLNLHLLAHIFFLIEQYNMLDKLDNHN